MFLPKLFTWLGLQSGFFIKDVHFWFSNLISYQILNIVFIAFLFTALRFGTYLITMWLTDKSIIISHNKSYIGFFLIIW